MDQLKVHGGPPQQPFLRIVVYFSPPLTNAAHVFGNRRNKDAILFLLFYFVKTLSATR